MPTQPTAAKAFQLILADLKSDFRKPTKREWVYLGGVFAVFLVGWPYLTQNNPDPITSAQNTAKTAIALTAMFTAVGIVLVAALRSTRSWLLKSVVAGSMLVWLLIGTVLYVPFLWDGKAPGLLASLQYPKTLASYPQPGGNRRADVIETLPIFMSPELSYTVVVHADKAQPDKTAYSSSTAHYWGQDCGKPTHVSWVDGNTLKITCTTGAPIEVKVHAWVSPKHSLPFYRFNTPVEKLLASKAEQELEQADTFYDLEDALKIFERALKVNPDYKPAYMGLLHTQYRLGYLKEDSLTTEKPEEIRHFIAEGYYQAGLRALEKHEKEPNQQRHLQHAQRHFKAALQMNPAHAEVQSRLKKIGSTLQSFSAKG